jgi:hypothetical protein
VSPIQTAVSGVRKALGKDGLLGYLEDAWELMKKAADRLAEPFIGAFDKMKEAVKDVVGFVKDLIDAVRDAVEWIGKIHLPKIDIPDLNPFGGAGNGLTVGPTMGVDSFTPLAQSFGNVVTSGYRPGDPGWHGKNRARDYAGGNMLAFARAMLKFAPKLLELIYTPLGVGVKNGNIVPIQFFGSAVMADHFDHVHVAMQNGGYVKRAGWAVVGEKGPELAHLPGGTNVYSNKDSQGLLGGTGGPLVHIEHAEFGSRLEANAFAERMAFRIATAG